MTHLTVESRQLVDQVFLRGAGWRAIEKTPMRRLMWRKNARMMRSVEAVHFVDHGDFSMAELRGGEA